MKSKRSDLCEKKAANASCELVARRRCSEPRKIYFDPLLENSILHVFTLFIFYFTGFRADRVEVRVIAIWYIIKICLEQLSGCEFTLHKNQGSAFLAKFNKLQASNLREAANVRSAFVDELTVDCMAEPQHRIFEREATSYSNRELQLCREGNEQNLIRFFFLIFGLRI